MPPEQTLLVGFSRNVSSSRWRNRATKHICRTLCRAIVGLGIMLGSVAGGLRAAVAGPNELVAFDLPAQPLASAIESYSVVSRWQVIYDASLATGRRSAPIKGALAPAVALRMLLAGTGLMPEYKAADGAVLVPDPMATVRRTVAPEPAPHIRDYYGRIQAGLERAFCADDLAGTGAYRIAIGFWIGSSGSVIRTVPLGSTGRAEIDAAFDRAVRRLAVGQRPPVGFDQPIVIRVTPDLLAQCHAAAPRPTKLAR